MRFKTNSLIVWIATAISITAHAESRTHILNITGGGSWQETDAAFITDAQLMQEFTGSFKGASTMNPWRNGRLTER